MSTRLGDGLPNTQYLEEPKLVSNPLCVTHEAGAW